MTVDATAAVRAWVNSLTSDLVGLGNPLPLGAHITALRSPAKGAYVKLRRIGGGDALTVESPFDQARVSATICGLTVETSMTAAVAYRNALRQLDGRRTPMGDTVSCQTVDNITGPLELDTEAIGHGEYRCLVDADFYLVLASALV